MSLLVDKSGPVAAHHVGAAVLPDAVGPRNLEVRETNENINRTQIYSEIGRILRQSHLVVDHYDAGIGLRLATAGEIGRHIHLVQLVRLDF